MRTPALLIAAAFVLAGCTEPPAANDADTVASPAATDGDDVAPASGAQVGPDFQLDQPITKEDARASLALASQPAYRPRDDTLVLRVDVDNQGPTALVGKGTMPVQVGVVLAGPEGADTPPGRRDFVRVPLPLVQPGSSANIGVQVPAKEILGLGVQLDIVQERVGWFGRDHGKPTLEVGTFQRCDGAEGTLCDASGTPLPLVETPPAGTSPARQRS